MSDENSEEGFIERRGTRPDRRAYSRLDGNLNDRRQTRMKPRKKKMEDSVLTTMQDLEDEERVGGLLGDRDEGRWIDDDGFEV